MKALVGFLGDQDIEALTFLRIREWKQHLDKGRSAATVRNYIIKLRVVLTYLKKSGYSVIDPDLIPVPQRVEKIPEYITAQQVALLIDISKRVKNKAIISFLYASGLRVSELCSLNRGDIHEGRFAVVGKGGKARAAFIDARTERLLDEYLQSRTDNNPALFLTDAGQRITPGVIQETCKNLRQRVDFEVHPHVFRHSYATNLMLNGMHIYTISRLLGHASILTTQRYLHIADLNLQEEYARYHTV